MSILTYLVPKRLSTYNPSCPPGPRNPGGGAATKVHRVKSVLSAYYDVRFADSLSTSDQSSILLLDPILLAFAKNKAELIDLYESHPGLLKVLSCTDQSIIEISQEERERVCSISDIVISSSAFQGTQLANLNIDSLVVTDPVPDIFFAPSKEPGLRVIAIGQISSIKNSQTVIEIYRILTEKGIRTAYCGGAALWGKASSESLFLERSLRSVTDDFYNNISEFELMRELQKSSIGLFCSYHDTGSESNLEWCATGRWSFYGGHGLWEERPGEHGLNSVEDFCDAILDYSSEGLNLPSDRDRRESHNWAVANCSFSAFLEKWQEVVKHARW